MRISTVCILLSCAAAVCCVPVPQPEEDNESFAENYLKAFFNLTEQRGPLFRQGANPLTKKLSEMQRFFGLEITGSLNNETMDLMKKPRCGVPDVSISQFSTYGNNVRWQTNNLTYSIKNYTPDMAKTEVDDSIKRALQVWAKVTPLRFTQINSETADIVISFVRQSHGDDSPFDGPGRVLAHAFAPSSAIGGDAHFDEDENFTFRSSQGVNLFLVAAHEFGHSLGLSHSDDRDALMYAYYSERNPDTFVLPRDDVNGIQSLYGPNPSKDPVVGPTPPTTPDACDSTMTLDAVATLRGDMLFFKDSFLWRRNPQNNTLQQTLISNFWPNAPKNIDAAYESRRSDQIFIFKDSKVYAYSGYTPVPEYPKDIETFGFPKQVRKIDAAFHDDESGKTLFFVGSEYYSYNEATKRMDSDLWGTVEKKRVDQKFSELINATAAFQYEGFTYVYNGPRMYKYSFRSGRLFRVRRNSYFLPCTNV